MKPSWTLTLSLLLVSMIVSPHVIAATWRTNTGLSNQLVYTDNVELTADDEQDGLSWVVTPRVSLSGEGTRLKLNFNYAPRYQQRFYSGGDSDFIHNLSADMNSELYEDFLFLDARANASLSLLDPIAGNPGDGINENDNTRQSYSLSISPYIRHRFGSYADLRLGYSFSKVWNEGSSSSPGHSVDLSLNSGSRFKILDWSLTGSYQKTEYNRGDDSIFASVKGRVGYAINRIWRVNAYVGYDDNDFLNQAGEVDNSEDTDGFAYGGGFTWTPSSRTTFDVTVADRYFGTNLYFDFKHRSRRSVWTASLSHEPNNARNETLNRQTFQNTDEFGNPIADPSSEDVFIDPDSPLYDSEDYIRRRLKLGYVHNLRRGSLGINAFYTERDYINDDRDTTGYGISVNWSHRLMANVGANLGVNWDKNSYDNDDPESTSWSIRAGLNRQLSPRTSVSLDLRHQQQDSDESSNEYTENRITLSFATNW